MRWSPAGAVLIAAALLLPLQLVGVPTARQAGVSGAGACQEVVQNGGFEGTNAGGQGAEHWVEYSLLGYSLFDTPVWTHQGARSAWLGGDVGSHDWISQPVVLPADAASLTLTFWWALSTEENRGAEFDYLKAQLWAPDGTTVITTTLTMHNGSSDAWDWNLGSADLTAFRGGSVELRFVATTDGTLPTHFFVDDVSIQACATGGDATPTPSLTPTESPTPLVSLTPTATSVWVANTRAWLPLIVY